MRLRPLAALGLAGCVGCSGEESPAPAARARAEAAPITAESLLAVIEELAFDRSLEAPGHARAQELLEVRLRASGLEVERLSFDWPGIEGVELANLQVRLPAAGPAAPILLLGAHYDTIPGTPGADDNASGVAVVAELARRLAGRPLERELRLVLFDAEEVGLCGSAVYADELTPDERARFHGALVLETLGFTDRRPGSQSMPPGVTAFFDPGDVGDFVQVVGNLASRSLAEEVAEALAEEATPGVLRVESFSALPGAGWLVPDVRRSDHARFWDRDLPAVLLTDTANFRNPHYHRASDRPSTLDGPFLAAIARGLERLLLR